MSFVSELEPRALWGHFDRLLTIPRASKQEQRMRDDVIALAERRGLTHRVDAAGNVVVYKPASAGCEGAPTVVIQGHLDMVCQNNDDVVFDWSTDPIVPRQDGDWLYATGTTLGADNGIGVAAMMALLDAADLVHGPLECLFTVDEETGLTGAAQLDGDLLGGRLLINTDSEEEPILTIGCAGGRASDLRVALTRAPTADGQVAIDVQLRGLKGGHSGVDIHLGRGNATQRLARALHAAWTTRPFRLAGLTGGTAHNAIPREARATLVVDAGAAQAVRAGVEADLAATRDELSRVEPELTWSLTESARPEMAWDGATTGRVLGLLVGLPHGVMAMSAAIPGLVETSCNLAIVAPVDDGRLRVHISNRSSVASALEAQLQRVGAIAALAGAEVTRTLGYPGWQPDPESPLLAVVQRVHERVLGAAPEVAAVHAGLECGIIGRKIPGIDMISMGPTIECPHSPDERVEIPTVGRFWARLTETLAELTRGSEGDIKLS